MKKVIIITEEQLASLIKKVITEQTKPVTPQNVGIFRPTTSSDATQTYAKTPTGQKIQSNPVNASQVSNFNEKPVYPMNAHNFNTLMAIGASLIPVVGPFVAIGISLYDAKTYYNEGKTKEAGLTALMALLPGMGTMVSKIPAIAKLGTKGMASLATKMGKSGLASKLTKTEVEVMNGLKNNANLVKTEVDKVVKNIANKSLSKASPEFKQQITNIAQKGLSTGQKVADYQVKKAVVSKAYNAAYDAIKR